MTSVDQATTRRGFVAGGVAAAIGATSFAARLDAAPPAGAARADPDSWIDGLTGEDRLLLDSPTIHDGTLLYYIMHFYNTQGRDYGRSDRDLNAVGVLYGETAPFALTDATWAKHRLGEFGRISDPTSDTPATSNPWRRTPMVRGKLMPQASIEALQARGALFLICDLALGGLAGRLAEARGGSAADIHGEFRATLLPGVIRVPNVVVSIQRAQRRGLPYYRV
jgi:hypothetical protein